MSYSSTLARLDGLMQSVDTAIRDLLLTEDDPFALAIYFWVIRRHDVSILHADGLSAWCRAWLRRVLVDREVGARPDDSVAAAALVAVSLDDDELPDRHELLLGLKQMVTATSLPSEIPLRQPAYGAIVSLAALRLGARTEHWQTTISRIGELYLEKIRVGPSFGILFAVLLMQFADRDDLLQRFHESIYSRLESAESGYEDRLYLVHAMMLLEATTSMKPQVVDTAFQTVMDSRVWSYLMLGTEEMPPVGSRDAPVTVSNLYRAALLDVMVRLQQEASQQAEAAIVEIFRGRTIIGIAAFGFGVACVVAVWWALLNFLIVPNADAAYQYWFQNAYRVMSRELAALYLIGVTALTLLLPWTLMFIWTTWQLLAVANVESDHYIADVIRRRSWSVLKGWLMLVAIGLGFSLFSNSITSAFIHTVGGSTTGGS